jgi:hypothetical protein
VDSSSEYFHPAEKKMRENAIKPVECCPWCQAYKAGTTGVIKADLGMDCSLHLILFM